MSDRAQRCPHCGAPQQQNSPTTPEPLPQKSNTGLYVALAVVLALALAGAAAYLLKDKIAGLFSDKTDTAVAMNDSTAIEESGEPQEKIDESKAVVELTPEFIAAVQKNSWLSPFSEGLAVVNRNGKCGFINTSGQEVVPCQYSNACAFHEGLAAICKGNMWGFIDTGGEEVIPANIKAEAVGDFSEGLAVIYKDSKNFSVIDKTGKTVFSGKYNTDWFWNTFDIEGGSVVPTPQYINGKVYIPTADGKFTAYDHQGNKVGSVHANKMSVIEQSSPEKTHTIFVDNNGLGLKDANGKVVIPAEYDYISGCHNAFGPKTAVPVNGVVLVGLTEYSGEAYSGYAGAIETDNMKTHYGYADLKGHDTFSSALKKRCKDSYQRAVKSVEAEEESDAVPGMSSVSINGRHVRLRTSPEINNSNILCHSDGTPVYLDDGTVLPYEGSSGDFYQVNYQGNIIYIAKQYSTLQP